MSSPKILIVSTLVFCIFSSCFNDRGADDDLMDLMDKYDTYEEPNPADVAPIEVNWETLISKELDDKKNVIFEAYVAKLPLTMYNYDKRELTLDFYERRNQIEGAKMRIDIVIGTSPAHVRSLPEDYGQDDLKIICEDGKSAKVGSKVSIEISYKNSTAEGYNYGDLTSITLIDDVFDESSLEDAVELTNEVIEDTTADKVYAYFDASMETSRYMTPFDGKYTISVNQKNNKYLERSYVYIGTTAGKMEQLHDGFLDKDFLIYDYKGEAQKAGSGKYRLYGTFNQLDVESKGVFTIEEIKKL